MLLFIIDNPSNAKNRVQTFLTNGTLITFIAVKEPEITLIHKIGTIFRYWCYNVLISKFIRLIE